MSSVRLPSPKRRYTKRSPIWRNRAILRATGMTIPELLAKAARTAAR